MTTTDEQLVFQANILRNIRDSVIVTDLNGSIIYWNEGATQLFGYTAEEMLGKTPALLYPDEPSLDMDLQSILRGHDYVGEWRGRRKDGSIIWIDAKTTALHDEQGNVRGFIGVSKDITHRKRIEEELQHSEIRARRLMDSNIIGVIVADAELILDANDAFLHIVGYTGEDLNNKTLNWHTMTPPEYQARDQQALAELAAHGTCAPYEKEYFRKDGSRVPVLIGAAEVERDPVQWLCFILDISEHKELERRKDEFIHIISHELRTPLAAMHGNIQLAQMRLQRALRQEATIPPAMAKLLHDVELLLNRAMHQTRVEDRLIGDLLDVARIQSNKLELNISLCDLAKIVSGTVEDTRQIAQGREIVLEIQQEPVLVMADADRIAQVVNNYLTNALKYSPPDRPIQVRLVVDGKQGQVSVQDYGPGLPREVQERIWERFYQAPNVPVQSGPGIGLGLGLSICQALITRHNGQVGLQSVPGEGATFWFTLPLALEEQPPTEI
jgi:PAS domain S-box-containing protein